MTSNTTSNTRSNTRSKARLAAMAGACALAGAAAGQSYDITNLGHIAGPAQAYGLNATGQAVGAAIGEIHDGSPFRAFLWDGSFHAIESLVGEHQSHGFDIDGAGAVYGASFTIGRFREAAFVSQFGPPVYLGEFVARGANDLGVVVGTMPTTDLEGWRGTGACVFAGGQLTQLPGLGGLAGSAMAVAETGDIVGYANLPGDRLAHATLWRGGAVHDLGTLGGPRSQALAVNNAGMVAGVADTGAGDPHAFVYEIDGAGHVAVRRDLGVLGERSSCAYGLNDAGLAVGTSDDRAFLWDGAQMIDLNTLIDPAEGWRLQVATAINDAGQIAGWGRLLGVPTAFLLTPACTADFNGDGGVDTRDVIAFLNAWVAGQGSADIDGNGVVDTRDVIAFLNLWTTGC
jgi:probable HAF family extracellular repeat protein